MYWSENLDDTSVYWGAGREGGVRGWDALDNLRSNDLARTTPSREEVYDCDALFGHGGVPFGFGLDVVDTHFGGCGGEVGGEEWLVEL